MKRLAIILLMCLYTAGVVGVSMAVHYCGQLVSSVSLGTKSKKCCCEKENEEPDGCCTTKIISAKVTDNHQPGYQPLLSKPNISLINNTLIGFNPPKVTVPPKKYNYNRWIPPPLGNPLYLRNRNILI